MASLGESRKAQRANGPATILAIATSTPPNFVYQADYPDYYFKITNCEHMTDLKQKFKRICEKSAIKKRHIHLTEEILKENRNIGEYKSPSLSTRRAMSVVAIPALGKEAALKAIKEWGQPKSKITHLIFCSTTGVDMPGADYKLTKLLGLNPMVKRFMLYHLGCYSSGTALRLAKDVAENNQDARILIVCSETGFEKFHGPESDQFDSNLVGQSLFGDGAGAVIVGADPNTSNEYPLYQLVSAAQAILPDSDGAIKAHLHEFGLVSHLSKQVPELFANNIEKCLIEAFSPIGINDWNSIFWITHPGGRAILDQVEAKLGLKEEKLRASRNVLSEYGNMSSASTLFILEEMRKKSVEEGKATTGEGLEWGVLFGFGPGLTVETVVLHSMPIEKASC